MKVTSRVFLVILRLVIGWHFLVEGLYKFETPWSGEAYLREASGPLGSYFRGIAGDKAVEDLTLLPAKSDSAQDQESAARFPPSLARDWEFYRDQLLWHYGLEEKEEMRA